MEIKEQKENKMRTAMEEATRTVSLGVGMLWRDQTTESTGTKMEWMDHSMECMGTRTMSKGTSMPL